MYSKHVGKAAPGDHDTLFLDDTHLLSNVVDGCGSSYPRTGFLNAPAQTIATYAVETDKKLIIASDRHAPGAFHSRAFWVGMPGFTPDDYGFLCGCFLGAEVGGGLDYAKIHRFAGNLDGHQLRRACARLASDPDLDTERFIAYLEEQGLSSNVDLAEVQQVELSDIKGCDDVIRSLLANIVVPLERDDLAVELGLKPKRGVLLAGPPGTGKTTVGRALAHRLRGKFFLVDGTVISGSQGFYGQIHQIFAAAQENAPSVIFIDDSDVIFESGEELGLYRYLLTMLDGLESESSGRVCIMFTAMDVANIPPALLRSGRIELWLEMRLPDAEARREILEGHLARLASSMGQPDVCWVVQSTEGFTRRLRAGTSPGTPGVSLRTGHVHRSGPGAAGPVERRSKFAERLRVVIDHIVEHGRITTREYAGLFGLSQRQAQFDLKSLTEQEMLQARGSGRGVHYVLASPPDAV